MRDRLEVQSEELATAFRAANPDTQRRVAGQMMERGLAAQHPPLEGPEDPSRWQAVAAELDASENEEDFRRARAAAAAAFLAEGAYEDALYEALHACADPTEAVREALLLFR
jgi:hypothetical protein